MASPKISVRLDNDTYSNLLKLAQIEHKTITELVRELIEIGLAAKDAEERQPDESAVMQRLDVLEMHLGELLVKAVKAGASARFLSRLAVAFGSDTVSWLTEQRLADGRSKSKFLADMEEQAERYAQEYLVKRD